MTPLAILTLLAGCAAAAADEPAPPVPGVLATIGVRPPDGWQRLDAAGAAGVTAAAHSAKTVATGVEVWGEPAAGCYLIAVEARGSIKEAVRASVDRLERGLAPLGVTTLPDPTKDVLDTAVPIAGAGLTGTARVRVYRAPNGTPQAIALACAGNEREPARCKAQCDALQLQLAPPVAGP